MWPEYLDAVTAIIRFSSMVCLIINTPFTWLLSMLASFCSVYNFYVIGYRMRTGIALIHVLIQYCGWALWQKQACAQTKVLKDFYGTGHYPSHLIYSSGLLLLVQITYLYYYPTASAYADVALVLLHAIALNMAILRIVESWLVWIVYDIFNAIVLWEAGLFYNAVTSMLYLVFAFPGYYQWLAAAKNTDIIEQS